MKTLLKFRPKLNGNIYDRGEGCKPRDEQTSDDSETTETTAETITEATAETITETNLETSAETTAETTFNTGDDHRSDGQESTGCTKCKEGYNLCDPSDQQCPSDA